MTEEIINSINLSRTSIIIKPSLEKKQGIYAFFLSPNTSLGKFGKGEQLIYIGISENLNGRDIKQHLKDGKTGWSSLRRSIGAILKNDLNLIAIKRDKKSKKLRADKYKFSDEGEKKLTKWMLSNLEMGFWYSTSNLSIEELRSEEEKLTIRLKPTLDLDKRTKKYNPFADQLDNLRELCRNEVKKLIPENTKY